MKRGVIFNVTEKELMAKTKKLDSCSQDFGLKLNQCKIKITEVDRLNNNPPSIQCGCEK